VNVFSIALSDHIINIVVPVSGVVALLRNIICIVYWSIAYYLMCCIFSPASSAYHILFIRCLFRASCCRSLYATLVTFFITSHHMKFIYCLSTSGRTSRYNMQQY